MSTTQFLIQRHFSFWITIGLLNSRMSGLRLLLLQWLGGTGKWGQMEGIIMEYKKMGGRIDVLTIPIMMIVSQVYIYVKNY